MSIKLGKLYFTTSEVYEYGLWQATATWNGHQYDLSETGNMTRRTARKYMLQRAYDYFINFKDFKP